MTKVGEIIDSFLLEWEDKNTMEDISVARVIQENNLVDANKRLIDIRSMGNSTVNDVCKKVSEASEMLNGIEADKSIIPALNAFPADAKVQLGGSVKNVSVNKASGCITVKLPTAKVITLFPKYMTELAASMQGTINNIATGIMNWNDVKRYFVSDPFTKISVQVCPFQDEYVELGFDAVTNTLLPKYAKNVQKYGPVFVDGFANRKLAITTLCEDVCKNIVDTFSMIEKYYNTLAGMRYEKRFDDNTVDALNMYMYRMVKGFSDVSCKMGLSLMVAINNAISAYTTLENISNQVDINVSHPDIPVSESANVDVSTLAERVIGHGGGEIIDLANRAYSYCAFRLNNNGVNVESALRFASDSVVDDMYPYGTLFNFLEDTRAAFNSIREGLEDEFASPAGIFNARGLDVITESSRDLIADLGNANKYNEMFENGSTKSVVYQAIIGELKNGSDNCRIFSEKASAIAEDALNLAECIETANGIIIKNNAVKNDIISNIKKFSDDFKEVVESCCVAIQNRYDAIPKIFDSIYDAGTEVIDVEECTCDEDYLNGFYVSSINDVHKIGKLMMEFVVETFKKKKVDKILGVEYVTEAETSADSGTDKKDSASPEVKEDKSQQSATDQKQNADAAKDAKPNAGEENTPEKKEGVKKTLKGIVDGVLEWFSNVVNRFTSNSQKAQAKNLDFIKSNKDAILNRSFNGITLNMYPYSKLNTDDLYNDTKKVSTNVNGITADNIGSYAGDDVKKLFAFLSIPNNMTLDEFLSVHYKGGDGTSKDLSKQAYRNTELKTLVSEMIEFCERFYGGGYTEISNSLNELKNTTKSKLESLKGNDKIDADTLNSSVKGISREVKYFSGSILNGVESRAHHYMYALRKLVPKTKANNDDIVVKTPKTGEEVEDLKKNTENS